VGDTVGEMLDAIGTLPSQKRIKEFVITAKWVNGAGQFLVKV